MLFEKLIQIKLYLANSFCKKCSKLGFSFCCVLKTVYGIRPHYLQADTGLIVNGKKTIHERWKIKAKHLMKQSSDVKEFMYGNCSSYYKQFLVWRNKSPPWKIIPSYLMVGNWFLLVLKKCYWLSALILAKKYLAAMGQTYYASSELSRAVNKCSQKFVNYSLLGALWMFPMGAGEINKEMLTHGVYPQQFLVDTKGTSGPHLPRRWGSRLCVCLSKGAFGC